MINRIATESIITSAKHFKTVSIIGPRQSGKTTLCKKIFFKKPYVSLEPIDTRLYAEEDPRGFLNQFPNGAIIDEIQNVPSLFSYIQDIVDSSTEKGKFILTGSQNFTLSEKISQSLAGRTHIETLMPLTYSEIESAKKQKKTIWEHIWQGGYPELYSENTPPEKWFSSYIRTYIEKDVRQIAQIGDIRSFSLFLSLLASHTSGEVNLNTISQEVGVSHNTIKRWTSILEQSFLIMFLPAFFANTKKQILKKPKIHFIDTGIACALLQIKSPDQLRLHPLRGALFENWIVSEKYKTHLAHGKIPKLFHYRENSGIEFDLLDVTDSPLLYEIKSGETFQSSFLKNFSILAKREKNIFEGYTKEIIYGGKNHQTRGDINILPWNTFQK